MLHENVKSWMQILKFLQVRMEADADQGQEITRKLFANKKQQQQQTSKKRINYSQRRNNLLVGVGTEAVKEKKEIALKYISLF